MSKVARARSAAKIREMRVEDLAGILDIERETKARSRAATYAPVPDSCIGGEVDTSVVAEVGDRIAGFVLGRIVSSPTELRDVAWIEFIGILPEYQRKGVGRRMVETWKKLCRRKGIKKVHVMINWRDWWMLSFFESLGFSRGDLIDFQTEL